MALQGTLDTFALPDVLRLLAATKKTGRLRLTGPRGTGVVSVVDGSIGVIDAPAAPHATDPVDALFELLRFEQGSFTFDADAKPELGGSAGSDVEQLLSGAESLLVEWREIESVVPSMDAWVTLRRSLVAPKVTIADAQWLTVVAVGSGATVRQMSDDLEMGELPVSRAVRDLLELGLIDLELQAPPGKVPARAPRRAEAPVVAETTADETPPSVIDSPDATPDGEAPLPTARPLRARRPRSAALPAPAAQPEVFVPLELPGHAAPRSYDDPGTPGRPSGAEDLRSAFPGLAARTADPEGDRREPGDASASSEASAQVQLGDDDELARQLATLSPRAAQAVRAAAQATTAEARAAALAEAEESEGEPIDRGLLLKFLSSVKG